MNKKKNNELLDKQIKVKSYIFDPFHTVQDLANILGISNVFLIKKFLELGIKTNINQVLNKEDVKKLCLNLNIEIIFEQKANVKNISQEKTKEKQEKNNNLIPKTPIVIIMGHVDHGKTTLLDTIRKTRLIEKEFGGITQHIGAYEITYENKKITFIDSPGHEAFFKMRSRGAKITDICLLIVAADDGVKPQTIESVKHAQEAQVEIIVVINKIDKSSNKKENIMTDLSNLGLVPELWGGKTPYIEISALKKEGIDDLLKMILLVSEIKNIQTDLTQKSEGVILEAGLNKNQGPFATFILSKGILKVGDIVVIGDETYCKIRSIQDDLKNNIKTAFPSQPVLITGLESVPKAGDSFTKINDKKKAKKIIEKKQQLLKEQSQQKNESSSTTYDNIFLTKPDEEFKFLNVIIKADTQGSLEVITENLNQLNIKKVKVNIIKASVGMINQNDINLAHTFNSLLINFNNPVSNVLIKTAHQNKVDIRDHNIIYKLTEDVIDKLKELVEPVLEEKVTGQAEIQKIFSISSVGNIAGCYVIKGTIFNNSLAKVIRQNEVIYKGKIVSLKHLKNNIASAQQGHECGILLDNFNNFQINDIIESSRIEKVNS
ncbi:MAG: translation initiation factor IF-2 [Candidatus Phytoplasma stylosanthis]|nr:translation initiation factor IF-2 [Candidatus Phytoplasma stylosanthis]